MDSPVQTLRVALIGNPNTGKTSLFNMLTGLNQQVGNYAGVTVEKKTGRWTLSDGRETELIDLPGAYSLAAASLDERIAVDVLSGHAPGLSAPDLVIVVVDVGLGFDFGHCRSGCLLHCQEILLKTFNNICCALIINLQR